MTKEEIVKQNYEMIFSSPQYDKSVNREMNMKYFGPAMDQYAKQILKLALDKNAESAWGIYCDNDGTYETIEEYYSHLQNIDLQSKNKQ